MKMSKKITALILVAMLSVCIAVPAFAEAYQYSPGYYELAPIADINNESPTDNFRLNVQGNHQVSQHRNVCVYQPTGSLDQRWHYVQDNDGYFRLKTALDESYALNVYHPSTAGSTHNCDIMLWASNVRDSALYYYSGSSDMSVWSGQIELAHHNASLGVGPIYNLANVVWLNEGQGGHTLVWR